MKPKLDLQQLNAEPEELLNWQLYFDYLLKQPETKVLTECVLQALSEFIRSLNKISDQILQNKPHRLLVSDFWQNHQDLACSFKLLMQRVYLKAALVAPKAMEYLLKKIVSPDVQLDILTYRQAVFISLLRYVKRNNKVSSFEQLPQLYQNEVSLWRELKTVTDPDLIYAIDVGFIDEFDYSDIIQVAEILNDHEILKVNFDLLTHLMCLQHTNMHILFAKQRLMADMVRIASRNPVEDVGLITEVANYRLKVLQNYNKRI